MIAARRRAPAPVTPRQCPTAVAAITRLQPCANQPLRLTDAGPIAPRCPASASLTSAAALPRRSPHRRRRAGLPRRRPRVPRRRGPRALRQRRARQQEVAHHPAPRPARGPQRRGALQAPRGRHDRRGRRAPQHPRCPPPQEVQGQERLDLPGVLKRSRPRAYALNNPRARRARVLPTTGVTSTPPPPRSFAHRNTTRRNSQRMLDLLGAGKQRQEEGCQRNAC